MIPDALVLLAGFVLAHAVWSVSDLPTGQVLTPLAIVEQGGQRQLLRFEAPTQERAIAEGKAALARRQRDADAWAFAREGVTTDKSGKVDVLSVDAWTKGMARPVSFVQKFSPAASGGFKIMGDALVIVDGKALDGAEAARLSQRLHDGAAQHPKVGQLWPGWRVK